MAETNDVAILNEYNREQTPLVLIVSMTTNTTDDPRSSFSSFHVIPKSTISEEQWQLLKVQKELEEEYFDSPLNDLDKEQEWHNCYTYENKEENPREIATKFRDANKALYGRFITPCKDNGIFLPYHYIAKYRLRLNIVDVVEMNFHFNETPKTDE